VAQPSLSRRYFVLTDLATSVPMSVPLSAAPVRHTNSESERSTVNRCPSILRKKHRPEL
jgi:hypothetical protein